MMTNPTLLIQYLHSQVIKGFKHFGTGMHSIHRYEKLLTSHTVSSFLAAGFNQALDVAATDGSADILPGPERLEYVDTILVRSMSESDRSQNR